MLPVRGKRGSRLPPGSDWKARSRTARLCCAQLRLREEQERRHVLVGEVILNHCGRQQHSTVAAGLGLNEHCAREKTEGSQGRTLQVPRHELLPARVFHSPSAPGLATTMLRFNGGPRLPINALAFAAPSLPRRLPSSTSPSLPDS